MTSLPPQKQQNSKGKQECHLDIVVPNPLPAAFLCQAFHHPIHCTVKGAGIPADSHHAVPARVAENSALPNWVGKNCHLSPTQPTPWPSFTVAILELAAHAPDHLTDIPSPSPSLSHSVGQTPMAKACTYWAGQNVALIVLFCFCFCPMMTILVWR